MASAKFAQGWVDDPQAVKAILDILPMPLFGATPAGKYGDDMPDHVYLWDADRKVLGFVLPPKNQGQVGSCFPAGTRIKMADGTHKPIEAMRLNDSVLTAEGNVGRVRHLFVRHEAEAIYRIGLRGHYGLRLTAEHPLLTKRGYVRADALTIGDKVAIPRYAPNTHRIIQTAQHRVYANVACRETYNRTFSGAKNFDRRTVTVQVKPVPDVLELTPGVGRIFGLFLAEGCTGAAKLTWSFNLNERETLVAELVRLLKQEWDVEAHVQERGSKCLRVNVYGRAWVQIFGSLCGKMAGGKAVHSDLMGGPPDFLEALYQGWLDGDGCDKKANTIQGTTVSHDLALAMFDIANFLGRKPALRHCDPKPSHGVKVRQRRYDLTCGIGGGKDEGGHGTDGPEIDAKHMWRRVNSISVEPFQGDVFNFEVEGDNSYVAEGIGVHNCVSFGTNTAIRRTMLSEIANGEPEEFKDIAEEVTYAGSRVEIGGGKISGDGSVGAWAAQFVQKWGVVSREVHGSYDLTNYSESRARDWGRKGVPDDLEPEAKKHPVKTISQVRTKEEAKRALAAGYGIAVCSNRGFTMKRDANGVCKPSGSWSHCLAIDGFHEEGGKLYFHLENSWGANAHTGPVGWGDPNTAGFWADGDVVEGMLRQNDSWAFSAVEGFPARRLNWYL